MTLLATRAQPDGNFFRLSDILTAASFLVLVTVYVVNSRNGTKNIGTKFGMLESVLKAVQDELKKMQELMVTQATQSERLNNHGSQIVQLQKEIADLRRGDGYIVGKDRNRGTIG